MRDLAPLLLTALIASAPATAAASWPQWLQGPSRQGLAEAPLPLAKPGLRWSAPAGGVVSQVAVADLDGDGVADVLSLEGGRAVARRLDGGVLWDTPPLQAAQIVDVRGADGVVGGDGGRILLRTKRTAAILDPATGAVLWQSPAELAADLWAVREADLQGDGLPELALVDNAVNVGTDGTVSVFTFPAGPASGALLAQTGPDCEGTPGRMLGLLDVDGDGVLDVVTSGRTHVCAWSATTGARLATSAELPDPLAVGDVVGGDVDGDGRDEIFVLTDWTLVDKPSRRVYALGWDGAALALDWTVTPESPSEARHTWPGRPLADADGDGDLDFVTSFWEQGAWTGRLLDAATGDPVVALPGRLVQDVVDVDGDGARELLCAVTAAQKPTAYADKALLRVSAGGEGATIAELLALPGALVRLGPFATPLGLGAGELVVARDADGDGIGDLLELRTLAAQAPVVVAPLQGTVSSLQPHAVAGEPRVGALYASGEVASLDITLSLRNDADGDGHGDLRYGGYLPKRVVGTDGPGALILAPRSGGRLALLDAAAGTPVTAPAALYEAAGNLEQHPLLVRLGPLGLGFAVLWRGPSGATNLVVRTLDGTAVSTTPLGGAGGTFSVTLDPLLFDADGDGADEIYLLAADSGQAEITHQLLAVDPVTGLRWPPLAVVTPGGNAGGLAALTVGPYAPALLLTASKRRIAVAAATGEVLHDGEDGVSHYYGQPVQADLDGDGAQEVVVLGTQVGALALEPDLSVRWVGTAGDALRGPGGVVPTAGAAIVAQARTHDARLFLFDGASGATLGVLGLAGGALVDPEAMDPEAPHPAVTHVVPVAALGPDGVPGFLVAADDGSLYAVDAAARALIWSAQLGGALGAPALVDVDGDGEVEVVVGVGTGHVAVVDDSDVDPVAWVRENGGSGPALTDAEDVDQQEAGDRVHVNWAAVADATSYVARVRSQNGTVLAERTVEAPSTQTTVDGLTLQIGQTYVTGVTAVRLGLGDVTSADEVRSDGVTVVDLSPPVIEGLAAEPAVFSPDGDGFAEETLIAASASDATRLAAWGVSIRSQADGATVRQWLGVANEAALALELPWDGTDEGGAELPTATYDVVFDVVDADGKAASASAQVTLCRPPFKEEQDACIGVRRPEPDAGGRAEPEADAGGAGVDTAGGDAVPAPDAAGAGDAGVLGAPDAIGDVPDGGGPEGCSCDQAGGMGGAAPGDVALWALLAAALVTARRREA